MVHDWSLLTEPICRLWHLPFVLCQQLAGTLKGCCCQTNSMLPFGLLQPVVRKDKRYCKPYKRSRVFAGGTMLPAC